MYYIAKDRMFTLILLFDSSLSRTKTGHGGNVNICTCSNICNTYVFIHYCNYKKCPRTDGIQKVV